MSSDSSGYEVINQRCVAIRLDCGYLSHVLILNKEDTASLLWKASSLGGYFKLKMELSLKFLSVESLLPTPLVVDIGLIYTLIRKIYY